MFRLSREVRFAVNSPEVGAQGPPANGFAGYPSLRGIGNYLALEVSLRGEPAAQSGCIVNIKQIDQAVREHAIPLAEAFVHRGRLVGGGRLLCRMYERLQNAWPPTQLHRLRLALSPFVTFSLFQQEFPMLRLSQKFEFCASHRLHNPALSDDENRKLFGKCNNPHGHGHNYVLQVSVAGEADANGRIIDIPRLEQVVAATVIDPLDHKYLNIEVPQFTDLIPTVENIAMVIFKLLKPKMESLSVKLAGVTLWETSKTWCEYME